MEQRRVAVLRGLPVLATDLQIRVSTAGLVFRGIRQLGSDEVPTG